MTLLVYGRGDGLHHQEFGLLMGRSADNALTEWEPIDAWLVYARFIDSHGNTSIFVCYAPTNSAPDDRKDEFYERLQNAVGRVVGDFNAVLGDSNDGFQERIGRMGVGNTMSENGVRFASFCLANELVIGGTVFQLPNIRTTPWVSPCGKYKNQIDHVAISRKHKSSLLDVRVRRGADVGSDHQLVMVKLRFKLKNHKGEKARSGAYDIDLLRREEEEKEAFRLECRNRFLVLEALEEEEKSV